MTLGSQIPRVRQDPTEAEFVQDPYPFYRQMRALGDFVLWEDYDMVMATTHVAASMVLRHPKFGRRVPKERQTERPAALAPFYAIERHSLLELEAPEHTRLRRVAMGGFDRASLAAMAPDISRLSDELIDAFPEGPFDLIEQYAQPLPAIVITRFLGIDEALAPKLQGWSNDMVAMYQARRDATIEAAAAEASSRFAALLDDLIAERKGAPVPGFLSELIKGEEAGDIQSRAELISMAVLLLNAGHEASVHTIGNSIQLLAKFPERALALEPINIAGTVEECLRFEPPLHMFTRHVYEDAIVLGQELKAGDEVGVLLGSACHDDSVWPDGEHFDPFRARHAHLALGSGIHACLGTTLARMELQILLPALFSRCPDLEIVEPPVFSNRYHFHGLERLMVTVR